MQDILTKTEIACKMYLTKELTESEFNALCETGAISSIYSEKLFEQALSEGAIKSFVTHPLTALAAGAALGAGGVYLGTHPELVTHAYDAAHEKLNSAVDSVKTFYHNKFGQK